MAQTPNGPKFDLANLWGKSPQEIVRRAAQTSASWIAQRKDLRSPRFFDRAGALGMRPSEVVAVADAELSRERRRRKRPTPIF